MPLCLASFVQNMHSMNFGCCLGHGEQEDINGHDAEGGCWSALQTVHFPHTAEHGVIAYTTSFCFYIYKAVRLPRC